MLRPGAGEGYSSDTKPTFGGAEVAAQLEQSKPQTAAKPETSGLPPVASSRLLENPAALADNAVLGLKVTPFEKNMPYDQAVAKFYGDLDRVFVSENPAEPATDALARIVEEQGIGKAAEMVMQDGGIGLDDLWVAQDNLRRIVSDNSVANGGEGNSQIHAMAEAKSKVLGQLRDELYTAGWDPEAQWRIALDGVIRKERGQKGADPSVENEGSTTETQPLYNGPKREMDPRIDQLVDDPDSFSAEERQQVIQLAKTEARHDSGQNIVIANMGDGQPRWAREFPNLYMFEGSIRSMYEDSPDDPAERTEFLKPVNNTHVIIETDDGQMYMIERTKDDRSASKQEFKVTSTRLNTGHEGSGTLQRTIRTEQLKDVIVRPGHPLVLGEDPETGKRLRTAGKVVRITSIAKDRPVASNHPFLQEAKYRRDAPQRFLTTLEAAKNR